MSKQDIIVSLQEHVFPPEFWKAFIGAHDAWCEWDRKRPSALDVMKAWRQALEGEANGMP